MSFLSSVQRSDLDCLRCWWLVRWTLDGCSSLCQVCWQWTTHSILLIKIMFMIIYDRIVSCPTVAAIDFIASRFDIA